VTIPDGVIAFSQAAERFCTWAETDPGEDDLYRALHHVAELYALQVAMPGADPEPEAEDLYVDKNDHVALHRRFQRLPFQSYGEAFDTTVVPPEEASVGDIADDLLDIYCDVKTGLTHYRAGHPVQAAFHWKFTWGVHWGRHATSALRALHCFMTKVDNSEG
jgi:hypothetical protein